MVGSIYMDSRVKIIFFSIGSLVVKSMEYLIEFVYLSGYIKRLPSRIREGFFVLNRIIE